MAELTSEPPVCKVFVKFQMADFERIKQAVGSSDVEYITDDRRVCQEILGAGHKVLDMNSYFGETDQKMYSIYEEAVQFAIEAENRLSSVDYKGVPLVTGMKVRLLEHATFIGKIKSILHDKRNVIFLFTELEYYYFIIPAIAMKMGYIADKIAGIKVGQIAQLEFSETVATFHKHIYKLLSNAVRSERDSPDSDRIKEYLASLELEKHWAGVCGCFLIDNEEGYYLKPVYPVIDKFKTENAEAVLFSFSTYTVRQVLAAGYECHDLDVRIGELELMMLHDNATKIVDFLIQARSVTTNNPIMASYLSCLLNDSVIRNLARILAIIAITDTVFSKFRYKTVLIATDGNPDNHVACSVASKYDITTFSIVPVVKQFQAIFGYLYMASRILVSGPKQKRELEKLGISHDRIVVTGSPRYDYIAQNHGKDQSGGRALVLVAMSRLHDNDYLWMSELIKYCNQEEIDIFIKLHPTFQYREDLRLAADSMTKLISEYCKNLTYQISYDADLRTLLAKATVFVTDYSSVGLEASLHGLPIITFSPSGKPYEDPNSIDFDKEGIALQALTIEDLFKHISDVIEDASLMHAKNSLISNPTTKQLQEARKTFNYELNYLNDGKAMERIFYLLIGSQVEPAKDV